MNRTVRFFMMLSAAMIFTAANSHAEETVVPAEKTGSWRFSMDEGSSRKTQKLRGLLQETARTIAAQPVMSPPKGFEVRFWGFIAPRDRFDICSGKKCPPPKATALLSMMVGRYAAKGETIKAAFGTASTMDISFNNLGHVFASLPVLYKDSDGFLLPEPVRDGERAGFPAYLNKGHAVAVIAASDRPLWLPVSRERYLKAAIAAEVKNLEVPPVARKKKGKKGAAPGPTPSSKTIFVEESRTWIDPVEEKVMIEKSRLVTEGLKDSDEVIKERIQKLQAELDAMPPEQRDLQARVEPATAADSDAVPLLPPDSSAGVAVVTPNFRYFNPKLPADTPQLAVIQWKFDGDTQYDPAKSSISDTLNNRVLLEIYKNMDWQKLRSKIK